MVSVAKFIPVPEDHLRNSGHCQRDGKKVEDGDEEDLVLALHDEEGDGVEQREEQN